MSRVLLALLLSIPAFAQVPSAEGSAAVLDRIPAAMQRFVDDHTVAGIVTLVARHGSVLEFSAEGMADREAQRPMKKDSIFQVMSMTKPFTAVGIMMLAEEGKLALRDPVERFLPEFRELRVATTTGPDAARLARPIRAVTVRDLMTHTSGMFDSTPNEISGYSQKMNIPLADLVRVYARQPLLFQPGAHWSYSSPGIDVLGRIIEVCSGEKYEDFIEQRLLNPLGMKDSFFYPTPARIPRIAMVYQGANGELQRSPGTILGGDPAKYRSGAVYPAPAWGLYSTAEDLLHFYQMVLDGGVYKGKRYLSHFSVSLMTEPHTEDIVPSGWLGGGVYGLAWEVVTQPYGELAGHVRGEFGHGGAFGTQGWIDPKNGLVRILMIQRSNGSTDTLRDTFMTMSAAGAVP